MMLKLAQIFLIVMGLVAHSRGSDELWEQWKTAHRKSYHSSDEEVKRRIEWELNWASIRGHNIRYIFGLESYALGLNGFSDLSWHEFGNLHLLQMPDQHIVARTDKGGQKVQGQKPFEEIDWREKGLVTAVKNQASCGSCWAFSTTGALEGQYTRLKSKQLEFSEQQLVDCSGEYGNHGCAGGLMENTFEYIRKFGIETEESYPYTGKDSNCSYSKTRVVTRLKGYHAVHSGNEEELQSLVSQYGPVSVAINADDKFMHYRNGVFHSDKCSSTALNHAVLLVGYGAEAVDRKQDEYWIVKNSWGLAWGEHGYVRMARNRQNMCGIATLASVPIL